MQCVFVWTNDPLTRMNFVDGAATISPSELKMMIALSCVLIIIDSVDVSSETVSLRVFGTTPSCGFISMKRMPEPRFHGVVQSRRMSTSICRAANRFFGFEYVCRLNIYLHCIELMIPSENGGYEQDV